MGLAVAFRFRILAYYQYEYDSKAHMPVNKRSFLAQGDGSHPKSGSRVYDNEIRDNTVHGINNSTALHRDAASSTYPGRCRPDAQWDEAIPQEG